MLCLCSTAQVTWQAGDVSIAHFLVSAPLAQGFRFLTWPHIGIFIIEGAITVGVCAVGWFLIVDFPAQAKKFLSPAERDFVIARLNLDRGDAEEDKIDLAKIIHHLKDWRLYFWLFNMMATTLPGYAYSYFLPIILRGGLGFSQREAQLLSAPPYVLAAFVVYGMAWFSDRKQIRGPIIAVLQLITAVGMIIIVYGGSNAARYFGAFISESAAVPIFVPIAGYDPIAGLFLRSRAGN
jgi:hypothetical protein